MYIILRFWCKVVYNHLDKQCALNKINLHRVRRHLLRYSESGSCINFTVEYSNPCSSSKTITVTGGAEANTSTGMEMTTSTTVTIGTGSGSTSGRMCFQAAIRPGTAHAACTTGGQC